MLQLLLLHAVAALLAPILVTRLGRKTFAILALAPASAAVWALFHTREILNGHYPTQIVEWAPLLGLELNFRLDTLSWLMSLIVGGVGALVLLYCTRYFSATAGSLGRFAAVFTAFAGAMFGLVTANNLLILYLFWELTTVFSFLLIGHYHARQPSRRAAMQAILTTTMGGLAMLGGLTMLGLSTGGSFTISEMVYSAASGRLLEANSVYYLSTAIALVLLGALTKAAQVPFHYWLPSAMAAPTPVSAYLHAAAMVKAGVYLIARLAPGFSGLATWQVLVIGAGVLTMLLGGYRALRQSDLKLVLAFGTVSQLGFIITLVGRGEQSVALAGITLLVSHAIFKACLFLTVGVIDLSTGTRDLRRLSGLGKQMPLLAGASGLAVASMAGLPPTLGFVAKEAALHALYESHSFFDQLLLISVVLGSILTLAYGLRWWWGAFGTKPTCAPTKIEHISPVIVFSPTLLGFLSLVLGLFPHQIEILLAGHASLYPGNAGHLALWSGFGVPLALTGVVVASGIVMFWFRSQIEDAQAKLSELPSADHAYRATLRIINNFAADLTSFIQRGSLPAYLSTMLMTMVGAAWAAILLNPSTWPDRLRWFDSYLQAAVSSVIIVAAFMVATARRRTKAVLLLGLVGYGVALLFALQGAPDLALTQAVVETVTLVVFMLVLRRMSPYFSNRPLIVQRWRRILIGGLAGITTALVGVLATGARFHLPVTVDYPAEVYEFGYGRNIVNVTLVDTRAWDTIGEISVLLSAATGIASLIFVTFNYTRTRRSTTFAEAKVQKTVWQGDTVDRAAVLRQPKETDKILLAPQRGQTWLPGSSTLAPIRRSVVLEVGARVVFHAMLMFALFLLFSGHNAPGGGFAGGMIAGVAFIVRYLAGGRYELQEAAPFSPGALLGVGMTTSTLAALVPLLFGGTILQTTHFDFHLPIFGEVSLATALFFDIGVFLIVLGLVLDILRSLGAQIDIQSEEAGTQVPEIDSDDPTEALTDEIIPVDLRDELDQPVATGGGAS